MCFFFLQKEERERSNLFDEITKQNNKKDKINKENTYTLGL